MSKKQKWHHRNAHSGEAMKVMYNEPEKHQKQNKEQKPNKQKKLDKTVHMSKLEKIHN